MHEHDELLKCAIIGAAVNLEQTLAQLCGGYRVPTTFYFHTCVSKCNSAFISPCIDKIISTLTLSVRGPTLNVRI